MTEFIGRSGLRSEPLIYVYCVASVSKFHKSSSSQDSDHYYTQGYLASKCWTDSDIVFEGYVCLYDMLHGGIDFIV